MNITSIIKPPLPLFVSRNQIGLKQFNHLPTFYLQRNWQGQETNSRLSCRAAIDKSFLYLSAEGNTKIGSSKYRAGDFVEGLWNDDVIELFLREDNSMRYQEFNLSPFGSWWSAVFDSPRNRATTALTPVTVEVSSLVENSSWKVGIKIPKQIIKINFGATVKSHANICACLGTDSLGCENRTFLSYTPFGGNIPDFHQVAKFSNIFSLTTC